MDEFKKIIRDKKKPDFTSHYASQEFSRKICEWNVYYIKTKKVPLPVLNFLNKNRILAGGAVLSILRGHKPNDYDIFFIRKLPGKFLDGIRNNNKYFESSNSITHTEGTKKNKYESINSITCTEGYHKVQFIKRLYENENRVIGGFDLDACRFYMNHRGEIYGTASAILSLRDRKIIINPCCQSENFTFRIMKYREYKRFNVIHPHHLFNYKLFDGKYDYERRRGLIETHAEKTITYILANKAHKCSIVDKPYSFELLNKLLVERFNENGAEPYCYFITELREKRFDSQDIKKKMMTSILREKYGEYLKVMNFMITNTSSQMTASFYPTNYKFSEIYPGTIFDILKGHLRAIFEIIRFGKMPKVIYYKIFRDYYDSFLLTQERVLKQN